MSQSFLGGWVLFCSIDDIEEGIWNVILLVIGLFLFLMRVSVLKMLFDKT